MSAQSTRAKPNPRTELARRVRRYLARTYPEATCALDYTSPLQLLVATILSAQCTDARVNQVTPALFAAYPAVSDYARADLDELIGYVRSTGFFRNKARSIIGAAQVIQREFDGRVPDSMEALLRLPGVARKSANVVLGTAFGTNEGIVVDTHVKRLSGRLGLSAHTDPVKIERDLMELVPRKEWTAFAHRLTAHGRQVCYARRPRCPECGMRTFCAAAELADSGPPQRRKK